MIKKKVVEYLERAEKIKEHLEKEAEQGDKKAAANGIGSGGKAKSVTVRRGLF